MTTRFQPTKSNYKQQQLKWTNWLVHAHDMLCDCPKPLEHTAVLIFQQEPELQFTTPEKDLIKKCISSDHGEDAGAVDDFGDDLEDLFKDDIGDEDAATG